ncbi:MAG: peptidoglycan bridge formation glycyltransferase FemA/FemB family protein [Paludibacter sp.]|nr:peptidoglycan bridge formation glycyltransferase FemA/FemB family protein [Paludibacter sp.]
MNFKLEKKELNDIRPTNILPQTSFWGRVKKNQGFKPYGFELSVSKDVLFNSEKTLLNVSDDLLVLLKNLNSEYCYAYIPYGPKIEPVFENQGLFLEELSEIIRPYLPPKCIFIRYDLKWENQWAKEQDCFDNSGNWLGPPENQIQEFRVNYKTNNWNLRKSPGDILPKNTFLLDLTKDEKDLLSNMRYNTRYNIKRTNKQGISIQEYGVEHIGDWYKLYFETAVRHNMPLQNENFFASILRNQDSSKNGVNIKMLMAKNDDEYLASMFLVLSKNRGTYLYGASSSSNKDMLASYALQWESIKIAKNYGCTEYDMFGSAPNLNKSHPLHGVHVYKKGFGGNLIHRMGCWDYPYMQKEYDVFKIQEIIN